MTLTLHAPDIREIKPRLTVFGVGGAGGNAVNNMIECGLQGVEFVVANTDAQALSLSKAERVIQMGLLVTEGLGAGAQPEVGRAAAEEVIDEIRDQLSGAHMVFITTGMGGGTGTGAAPVVARIAREMGILTVGVVTKPFHFEGARRMRLADAGIVELQRSVDTLIVIPNQNLFRVATERTTFSDAFAMADQVLYSGVASITDLMVKPGHINLDFADVRAVMREMGKAMMGTGEATGERRAVMAAEAAIANPLLDEVSMRGAKGLLISITGGRDMALYEVDEAASRIREEVDPDANIIVGATQDESLDGIIRVSVVATGIDQEAAREAVAAPVSAPAAARPRPLPRAAETEAAPAPAPAPAPQLGPVQEAPAALAPAPLPVAPQPLALQPLAFQAAPAEAAPAPYEAAAAEAFVPPAPERVLRQVRMPHVDELPAPGRRQVLAQQGLGPRAEAAPERRMTLLQRLAAVGLGRAGDEAPAAPPPARPVAPPRAPLAPQAPEARRPAVRPPVSGGLDAQGRATPRPYEDDHLEIPAFLRRQANS